MSVVNTADIFEVWFAADRFDWLPFLVDVIVWTAVFLVAALMVRKRAKLRRS
jgi:hypothetical protein